ncbi:MAG: TIGR04452 family lipoprotein [Leptospiraceae bacterium]|nr:TIGR04452 family lipoprotein [Leptospiraceae bacterium]
MRKIFTLLVFVLSMSQCIVLDTLNLSVPESVTGKEAKSTILTAAITGAAISSSAIEGKVSIDALLSLISNKLAGVKENAFYDKYEVDQCAAEAQLINIITIRVGGFTCNLKEHKTFTNWPVRIF